MSGLLLKQKRLRIVGTHHFLEINYLSDEDVSIILTTEQGLTLTALGFDLPSALKDLEETIQHAKKVISDLPTIDTLKKGLNV